MNVNSYESATGWSSRSAFILASVGFAVGLGNIWRFPYVTGENGGAAFVLIYLLCVFTIGVPILMAEFMLGRRGKMSPPYSMRNVAQEEGRSKQWQLVGGMNLLASFLVIVVYSVVTGWVLNYLYQAITTGFVGITAEAATASYEDMLQKPETLIFWSFIGLGITGIIVSSGLQNGVERAVKILMPTLFGLMLILAVYNMIFSDGFDTTVEYLFTPDFSKIDSSVVLAAIGQAFFSIGVAFGGMMTFGAYLPKNISIPRSALIIVSADTLVALVGGLVVFPAVFSNGLDAQAGTGLVFQTLPVAFNSMPGTYIISVLFFLLLSAAAITSMVGMTETITHWVQEYKGFSRKKSAILILSIIGFLSVFSVLGYNVLSEYQIAGKDINGITDFFSVQILLPLGGMLLAIFAGWCVSSESSREELGMSDGIAYKLWLFSIRYIVPFAIFLIFILGIF